MTAPAHFKESLSTRAFPHRYRKVGSPTAFLDSIGIVPIVEYIYKGNTVIDCAEEMDIPVTHFLNWLDMHGYTQQIEDAYALSAQGYLSKAARDLKAARTDMDFKKAKEMLSHARFMASKHDRSKYGEPSATNQGPVGGIQYVFNIGQATPEQTLKLVDGVTHAPPQPALEHAPQEDAHSGFGAPYGVEHAEPVTLELGPLTGPFVDDDAPLTLGID